MKTIGAIVLLIGLTFTAFSQTPAEKTSRELDQALMAKSKAVADAIQKKGSEFLGQNLAPDFAVVWGNGHVYGRGEIIGIAHEGQVQELSPYHLQVISISDSSAIVTYDCILRMPEEEGQFAPRYQHGSDLWVKTGDQWLLKFQQFTPIRPVD